MGKEHLLLPNRMQDLIRHSMDIPLTPSISLGVSSFNIGMGSYPPNRLVFGTRCTGICPVHGFLHPIAISAWMMRSDSVSALCSSRA